MPARRNYRAGEPDGWRLTEGPNLSFSVARTVAIVQHTEKDNHRGDADGSSSLAIDHPGPQQRTEARLAGIPSNVGELIADKKRPARPDKAAAAKREARLWR